jgi:hypothetical protein
LNDTSASALDTVGSLILDSCYYAAVVVVLSGIPEIQVREMIRNSVVSWALDAIAVTPDRDLKGRT